MKNVAKIVGLVVLGVTLGFLLALVLPRRAATASVDQATSASQGE